MKKFAVIIMFLSLIFITSCSNKEVAVIFNAPEYAKITKDQLYQKLGEPKYADEWTNKTSKGDFRLTNHTYFIDNLYLEITTFEDIVVKIHAFPNETNTFKFENNYLDIFKQFGMDVKSNIKPAEQKNNKYLKLLNISDAVEEVEIYHLNKSDKTYNYVYITFDSSYFD